MVVAVVAVVTHPEAAALVVMVLNSA